MLIYYHTYYYKSTIPIVISEFITLEIIVLLLIKYILKQKHKSSYIKSLLFWHTYIIISILKARDIFTKRSFERVIVGYILL